MESDSKVVVFKKIPFELQIDQIIKQMHVHGDTRRYEADIKEMIEIAAPVARPKALYKVCCVENRPDETLDIDKVNFNSRLIKEKLGPLETVFVCMTTAGTELEAIQQPADVMKRFCLDAIKNTIMFYATNFLRTYLTEHYKLKQLSNLNPGETASFPIDQQRKIFTILGDVEVMIGVKLSENCALIPTKSHSGVYYSTETEFISCRLCTNPRCLGRRAPYEADLAKKYE